MKTAQHPLQPTNQLTPLQQAEKRLNALQFEGMPIGYLSAPFFDKTWFKTYDTRLHMAYWRLFKTLGKAIRKRSYLKDSGAVVLYHRSGYERHYKTLESAVRLISQPETDKQATSKPEAAKGKQATRLETNTTIPVTVVGPWGESDVPFSGVYFHSRVGELLNIVAFLLKNRTALRNLINARGQEGAEQKTAKPTQTAKASKASQATAKRQALLSAGQFHHLNLHLCTHLLKGLSARRFLQQQKNLKLVCLDFDRSGDACVLVSAAKSLKLPTVTLQHGVFSPPVAYVPLLADQCFTWGEMTRQQFIVLGEDSQRIINTGTPIVESIPLNEELRQAAAARYQLKPGRTFLLALSGPDKPLDEAMAALFEAIKNTYGQPDDNFLVKTHPSYKQVDYSWLETNYGLKRLPLTIPYVDVMNLTDILLCHNSGFGAEALYFGKQVGVMDIPGFDAGNGLQLHLHAGVPLIHKPEDVERLLEPLNEQQRSESARLIFHATGKEAARIIAEQLKTRLKQLNNSAPTNPKI